MFIIIMILSIIQITIMIKLIYNIAKYINGWLIIVLFIPFANLYLLKYRESRYWLLLLWVISIITIFL
jgi:hypothetical protein